MTDFIDTITWRGMLHDMTPELNSHLKEGMRSAYLGFDPTADSLHIGHLVGVMTLVHFQRAGHKPLALIGGATGMIGDPSFKSTERNLLDMDTLTHNVSCIKNQLSEFLDFSNSLSNRAEIVNNYDWMSGFSFLDFIRDVGKHLTVNYMMSKDSVRKRIEEGAGMSFTEFSYQLIQGYDFYHLWKHKGVTIQLGGSDQWGNIVTGTELIRRMEGGTAYALTVPLITKADGSKFGKTESGSIWLDPGKTSPYAFYQFWLNISDDDAKRYIKIFTTFSKEETESLINEHQNASHLRILQKTLGREVTTLVHGEGQYKSALKASEILFGKSSIEDLQSLDERTFLEVFEGVPMSEVSKIAIEQFTEPAIFLADIAGAFPSRGEARRMLQQGAVLINKVKWTEDQPISCDQILNGKYMVIQKGKKNYFLVKFV